MITDRKMCLVSSKYFVFQQGSETAMTTTVCLNTLRKDQWWMEDLYEGAEEVGICILSHKTGAEVRFALDWTEQDTEGGILAWHFRPLDNAKGINRITVFNVEEPKKEVRHYADNMTA